ncbi:MAG: hypothetical protein JW999_09700 [Methanotrichaceae archaeon]|nr:hypothetical protein [Methanotrichaceae archaeon]
MLEEQKFHLQALRFNVKTRVEAILEGDIARIIQKVADEERMMNLW